jgi:NADP-dependent aldehyde dehydrogenase
MDGSLTGTIHAGKEDAALAKKLFPIIESKVGRLLWGGFPPGVIPGIATHHGGPWPATTDSRHTSIGLFAYRRFVRPVCRQGFPQQT